MVTTEKARVPAQLLIPVKIPPAPDPDTMNDSDIGALIQRDEQAIRACNAKLNDIGKLVEAY